MRAPKFKSGDKVVVKSVPKDHEYWSDAVGKPGLVIYSYPLRDTRYYVLTQGWGVHPQGNWPEECLEAAE